MTAVPDTRKGTSEPKPSPSANTKAKSAFRPDIEGLRAIAVLLVVISHAQIALFGFELAPGGYVGVDVFFVISGFLITTLLVKELKETGTISIKKFYARRATRLLPASALVLVVTLVASWLWLPFTRITSLTWDAIASSFYMINYRLAFTDTDYMNADAPPSPMQHFWSLAVEEQFYFVWPLLLLAIVALCAGHFRRRIVVAALSVVLVSSLAISAIYTQSDTAWSYFGIHTRAWELAAGALVALFAGYLTKLRPSVASMATWAGVGMILVAAVTFTSDTVFPGYAALLPVAGTALAIAGGCSANPHGAGLVLNRAPFQFVGKISYSYYLWHWPILMIAPAAFGKTGSVPLNTVLMVGALVVTWITFRFVEDPIRNRKSLKIKPWRGIRVGVALTTSTAALALVGAWAVPMVAYSSGTVAVDTTKTVASSSTTATVQNLIRKSENIDSVPQNLTPPLETVEEDRPEVYDSGCNQEISDSNTQPKECEYGDVDSDETIVLFGDSHAAQWFPAVDKIGQEAGMKVVPITRSGCPIGEVDIYHDVVDRHYYECNDWRDNAFEMINDINPEMIVTTSANGHKAIDPETLEPVDDPDEAMVEGWEHTFTDLRDASSDAEITYLVDTPNFGDPVPDCVAENLKQVDSCNVSKSEAMLRPERTEGIVNYVESQDNMRTINPFPWFCADNECPVIIGNSLLLRDSNHITTDYIKAISPLLQEELLNSA